MAWSSPATYSTGEIVVASKLNTHIRDNLRYLKGLDGGVTIDNVVTMTGLAALRDDGGYQFTLARAAATARTYGFAIIGSGANAGAFALNDVTAAATRFLVDITGNVGIGTANPAGKLHVAGAAGGMLSIFAAGVGNTLVNVTTAIVTRSAFFWLTDHNTATGVGVGAMNGTQVAAGGSTTYANTDTITVAVTAGGIITFQRTAGASGAHDIRAWVQYE